jgi:hypothetical protein
VLHERHLVLSKRDYGRDGNLAAAAAAGDAGQGGVLSWFFLFFLPPFLFFLFFSPLPPHLKKNAN